MLHWSVSSIQVTLIEWCLSVSDCYSFGRTSRPCWTVAEYLALASWTIKCKHRASTSQLIACRIWSSEQLTVLKSCQEWAQLYHVQSNLWKLSFMNIFILACCSSRQLLSDVQLELHSVFTGNHRVFTLTSWINYPAVVLNYACSLVWTQKYVVIIDSVHCFTVHNRKKTCEKTIVSLIRHYFLLAVTVDSEDCAN